MTSGHGVQTYGGELDARTLGVTLIHEHVFVRDQELERNLPGLEWDEQEAVERAVRGLTTLYELGVRTVVDLTVLGLGRDVGLVKAVAGRVPVNLVASTGFYGTMLPLYFRFLGSGLTVDGPDPLAELFVREIEVGIAGTAIHAGMIKVTSGEAGFTDDVQRVFCAAALTHQRTGVPITTHSEPRLRNGIEQQRYLRERGVSPTRIVIGHSGDSEDLTYLRTLMDNGSTIGMDRFGMEHVLSDARRCDTVVALVALGYADRMVLSHDAAFFSHVTPPSWRQAHAPHWDMEHLFRRIVPSLLERGVSTADVERMLVSNPRLLLAPGTRSEAA
jgi:phosphotriesterase-related protein